MDLFSAIRLLEKFKGVDLTTTLARIESAISGLGRKEVPELLIANDVHQEALSAAGLVKEASGQINVMIHALGILLCLPAILELGECVESVSLGAGNTGKKFDLETNRRVAEFKFINWRGGPEAIRQNSLFKDFYCLAEHPTEKSKHLYVLGTKYPLKFFKGQRALNSVLSKNVKLYEEFRNRYPECVVVRDYYTKRMDEVAFEDLAAVLSNTVDVSLLDIG